MSALPILKVLGRLIGSIGLAILTFLATTMLVPGLAILIWLLPGKVVAPLAAFVLPHAWVYGDPSSENYWRQVELGGFVIMCGVFFWAMVIFALWQWRAFRKPKTKERYV